jgi:hypothetical protein
MLVVLVPCCGTEEGEVDVLLLNIPVTRLFEKDPVF